MMMNFQGMMMKTKNILITWTKLPIGQQILMRTIGKRAIVLSGKQINMSTHLQKLGAHYFW